MTLTFDIVNTKLIKRGHFLTKTNQHVKYWQSPEIAPRGTILFKQ